MSQPRQQSASAGESPARRISGMADPPRPFVLRAAHLNGCTFEPDSRFEIDIHLFDRSGLLSAQLLRVLQELSHTGLGPGRARVDLLPPEPPRLVELDLDERVPASCVTVRFVTPTELKGINASGSGEPQQAPFDVLFARARDRVSALAGLYGEGPPDIDFAGMGRRAARVRTVRLDLRRREVVRRSTRTGQVHGIGGFTGFAEYAGDVTEFLPYLRAGWWTGIGRHTVWGNGVIACE